MYIIFRKGVHVQTLMCNHVDQIINEQYECDTKYRFNAKLSRKFAIKVLKYTYYVNQTSLYQNTLLCFYFDLLLFLQQKNGNVKTNCHLLSRRRHSYTLQKYVEICELLFVKSKTHMLLDKANVVVALFIY